MQWLKNWRQKIEDHDQFITTLEFNGLKKRFNERFKLAKLVIQSDLKTILQKTNKTEKRNKNTSNISFKFLIGINYFSDSGL